MSSSTTYTCKNRGQKLKKNKLMYLIQKKYYLKKMKL